QPVPAPPCTNKASPSTSTTAPPAPPPATSGYPATPTATDSSPSRASPGTGHSTEPEQRRVPRARRSPGLLHQRRFGLHLPGRRLVRVLLGATTRRDRACAGQRRCDGGEPARLGGRRGASPQRAGAVT